MEAEEKQRLSDFLVGQAEFPQAGEFSCAIRLQFAILYFA
jgi:hypothetical protein